MAIVEIEAFGEPHADAFQQRRDRAAADIGRDRGGKDQQGRCDAVERAIAGQHDKVERQHRAAPVVAGIGDDPGHRRHDHAQQHAGGQKRADLAGRQALPRQPGAEERRIGAAEHARRGLCEGKAKGDAAQGLSVCWPGLSARAGKGGAARPWLSAASRSALRPDAPPPRPATRPLHAARSADCAMRNCSHRARRCGRRRLATPRPLRAWPSGRHRAQTGQLREQRAHVPVLVDADFGGAVIFLR